MNILHKMTSTEAYPEEQMSDDGMEDVKIKYEYNSPSSQPEMGKYRVATFNPLLTNGSLFCFFVS